MATYNDVIRHWPNSEAANHALHNKAVCLMRKQRWEEAIAIFKSISNYETAAKTICGNLAQCHARLRQKQQAEDCFSKLQEKFGSDDYVIKVRADLDSILAVS